MLPHRGAGGRGFWSWRNTPRSPLGQRGSAFTSSLLIPALVSGQYVVENLGRGVVAVRASETTVYVGWRLLGTDPAEIAFNVYRSVNGATPSKLNTAPITATTNFVDSTADFAQTNVYTVRPIRAGRELAASAPATLPANAPVQQFLTVPLQRPADGSVDVPFAARASATRRQPSTSRSGGMPIRCASCSTATGLASGIGRPRQSSGC
jgi:hypothetical protein